MENFKIQKGIPIPVRQGRKKYPFREIEVGDSVLFKNYSKERMTFISNSGRAFAAKSGDCTHYKFLTRKEGNNIRIWRVK